MDTAIIRDAQATLTTLMDISGGKIAPAQAPTTAQAPVDASLVQLEQLAAGRIEALVLASRLLALQAKQDAIYELQLQLGQQRLTVESKTPFAEGTRLEVEKSAANSIRVVSILSQPPPRSSPASELLQSALRESLPRQEPPQVNYQQIKAIADHPELPPRVRASLQQLLAVIPNADEMQNPALLKRALERSGTFFEHRLSMMEPGAPTQTAATLTKATKNPPSAAQAARPATLAPQQSALVPRAQAGIQDASLGRIKNIFQPLASAIANLSAAYKATTGSIVRPDTPINTAPSQVGLPAAETPTKANIGVQTSQQQASATYRAAAMLTSAAQIQTPNATNNSNTTNRPSMAQPAVDANPTQPAGQLVSSTSPRVATQAAPQIGYPSTGTTGEIKESTAPSTIANSTQLNQPRAVATATSQTLDVPLSKLTPDSLTQNRPAGSPAPAPTMGTGTGTGTATEGVTDHRASQASTVAGSKTPQASSQSAFGGAPTAAKAAQSVAQPDSVSVQTPVAQPSGKAPASAVPVGAEPSKPLFPNAPLEPVPQRSSGAVSSEQSVIAQKTGQPSIKPELAHPPANTTTRTQAAGVVADNGRAPPLPDSSRSQAAAAPPLNAAAGTDKAARTSGITAHASAPASPGVQPIAPTQGRVEAISLERSPLEADLKLRLTRLMQEIRQAAASRPGATTSTAQQARAQTAGDLYTARGLMSGQVPAPAAFAAPVGTTSTKNQTSRQAPATSRALSNAVDQNARNQEQLMKAVDSAVARTRVNQFSSLRETRSADSPAQATWITEVPLQREQAIDGLRIKFEDHGETKDKDGNGQRMWQVLISLDIEDVGPLHALLKLRGDSLSATLWAERNPMFKSVRAMLRDLELSLAAEGVAVDQLECRQGKPESTRSSGFHQILDVST